eukprot:3942266-Heterocapsa_arctica.AAC.1
MGRWASAEVLKYVEEAFGARTAAWCRSTAAGPPVADGSGVGCRGVGGAAPASEPGSSLAARSFRAEQLAELG